MDIIDNMKERYDHSLAPITGQGGVNQGDLMFAEKAVFLGPDDVEKGIAKLKNMETREESEICL